MQDITQVAAEPRLKHFPVPFFATVMGIMGLTLALHAASSVWPAAESLSLVMMWLGIAVFVLLSLFYVAKAVKYPAAVKAEWNHPVRLAFFPAISISLLLIAAALSNIDMAAAKAVWIIGTALQGSLTIAVVSGWISHRSFEVGHLTPAWFIPAVGNVIVPVAGARLGYFEISWLFFSTGMIFWVVLLTLVFNRLIFHNPIPGKLFPTMVILIAPPTVAFIGYLNLVGEVDNFARFLINVGYVFAALVVVQAPKIAKLPFALPFWALSFPIASLSISSFLFARKVGSGAHELIGIGALLVLVVIMAALIYRTILAIMRDEICVPE